MSEWSWIKPVYKKRKLKHPFHSSQRNHLLKVTERGAYKQKILAPGIRFPPLFLALLLCITKHGSCEWVGVEWLDSGAKAPSVVFLLPCSLFAPSLYLTTPLANTLGTACGFCNLGFTSHKEFGYYNLLLFGLL